MAWWIVAFLALAVILLALMYRQALAEGRHLTNFALLILLDDKVHAAQRHGLTDLVRSIEAKSAADLYPKVSLATTNLATKLSHTILGTSGLLWQLRQTG
jgi:hypothetical protein